MQPINKSITSEVSEKILVNYIPENIGKCFDDLILDEPSHMIMIQSNNENCVVVIVSLFCDKNNSYIALVSDSSEKYDIPSEPDIIPIRCD